MEMNENELQLWYLWFVIVPDFYWNNVFTHEPVMQKWIILNGSNENLECEKNCPQILTKLNKTADVFEIFQLTVLVSLCTVLIVIVPFQPQSTVQIAKRKS